MPDTKTRERFERLSAICLALPEAVREDQGSHASFRVAKKVFAYYLNDHHGDGIVSICCKALPGDNERLIARIRESFICPPTSARVDGSGCASTGQLSIGLKSKN
jgi:hypothetical protein